MVCIRCQKRPAIIFIQRMENGQMKQEVLSALCPGTAHQARGRSDETIRDVGTGSG